jgi:hypothetical protein
MQFNDVTRVVAAAVVLMTLGNVDLAEEECEAVPRAENVPENTVGEAASDHATTTMDVDRLTARLRASEAVGFFTKLALKNQIDDLLDQFRHFHNGEEDTPLPRLREQFNLLLMKVITLLQDKDPELFREITASREVLWQKLADPKEFAQL